MTDTRNDEIRDSVRQSYAQVAKTHQGCCGKPVVQPTAGQALGYSNEDLESVPEGSEMGLGCGNPQAIAALKRGETVLDLGSGGGFDCFLAARQVGESGKVIGVDMTPEMLTKARANAAAGNYSNVEFRLGEIEHLPVADGSVDVILSNCVINLSPDKRRVFAEAFRVLKPGGRLAISDVVAVAPMSETTKQDLALHSCCVAGAASIAEVEHALNAAGFERIRVDTKPESREFIRDWAPGLHAEAYVVSATIQAVKPNPESLCTDEADELANVGGATAATANPVSNSASGRDARGASPAKT